MGPQTHRKPAPKMMLRRLSSSLHLLLNHPPPPASLTCSSRTMANLFQHREGEEDILKLNTLTKHGTRMGSAVANKLKNDSRCFHTSPSRLRLIQGKISVDIPDRMTEEEVRQRVLKAIKAWDRFPQDRAEKLTLEARFKEDLGFDSLDLVEIVMKLEEEFELEEITIEDGDNFKTPEDVAKYVIEHFGVDAEDDF